MVKRKRLFFMISILFVSLLAACGSSGSDEGTIKIGGKPWTEQYILPQIVGQYIEAHTDLDVQYEDGLGEVAVITPAIDQGDIDIYVEYTGTGLEAVLNEQAEERESSESVFQRVKEGYEEKFNVTWLEPLGFENTYTLAYHPDADYDAQTFSDLVEVSQNQEMSFGAPHPFYEREGDGYDAMIETYPFDFSRTDSLDPNVMYEAVYNKEVDLIPAFTTDGKIERYGLQATTDDLGFFPKYDAAPLIRMETLENHPELEDVINELAGQISEEEMQEMNAKVDIDDMKAEVVAEEFLKGKGLID
ncbi:glycine betaine ABC transporter substrate-binding protein [Piscibacillus halophilus]|uniref:Osmoprotectant transport system substrate-binding protein/osmoprotectant transport system permease protein n=1 Tax=Piscibacillus halophilus TaxID=571933 RepID=A0A1H9FU30_9BACI|nr:glycine betaine ABC transporter substrate-binding protein [Piscibacillus halophilus]SEQ41452.1 osmoprotectant transport system substrate-binding protein/osmoprotectant transport system permease protein [Piscibacillus halophilus]